MQTNGKKPMKQIAKAILQLVVEKQFVNMTLQFGLKLRKELGGKFARTFEYQIPVC